MREVVPHFYQLRDVGTGEPADGFGNHLLRVGFVRDVVYPDDPRSRTAKFVEYNVVVQHRENNTAVTKLYENCLAVNPFGALADYAFWSLRAAAPVPGTDETDLTAPNSAAQVLVLCINGGSAEAVILGGIRDDRQDDKARKARGHHAEFVFNGVRFTVADDGAWRLAFEGPTTPEGALDAARGSAAAAGTTVEVAKDGSFRVATKDNQQVVEVNHAAGAIKVTGAKDVTVDANTIHLGTGAGEKAVLGDTLVSILGQLLDLLSVDTHTTPVGIPTGPSLQGPAYAALRARLQTALSAQTFVKRSG